MIFDAVPILTIGIGVLIACIVVAFVIPSLVLLCFKKGITDVPNKRKLQKHPIPVLGGFAVYVGTLLSLLVSIAFWHLMGRSSGILELFFPLTISCIMFYVGLMDDMVDLKPNTKFILQILTVLLLYSVANLKIDELHGLFGLYHLEWYISLPLSLLAGVGLINAINLIDGVNGLASGFGIISSVFCGVYCALHHDMYYTLLSFVYMGALIPFFIINVFSVKYKMFIGDSGSLLLGTLAFVLVCRILDFSNPLYHYFFDFYAPSFLIAVFAMPVFDCLRVMSIRILKKSSPFKPDKTHLHHYLIEIGCSHFLVTIIILSLSIINVSIWFITALLHLDPSIQFIIVIITAVCSTWGVFYFFDFNKKHNPAFLKRLHYRVRRFVARNTTLYYSIQTLLDKKHCKKLFANLKKRHKTMQGV